jgi:membrane-bound lytic murein transglycosylase A
MAAVLAAALIVSGIGTAAGAPRPSRHGGTEARSVKLLGTKLRPAAWRRAATRGMPVLVGPPGPLKFPDSQIEPVAWRELTGWAADDHASAFKAFLASCRPIARVAHPPNEARDMYPALRAACRRALAAGALEASAARTFFEENFRPARIARLGEYGGFLTGYYEPIVDGSRFPTGIFKVPIYRRPHDLVPPANKPQSAGFPNTGQSMRRTAAGALVPYFDRGQILDGALDGRRLEICWIKDATEALFIQIQGSARVRLEDGTMLRINYDAHNGYSYVPVGRVLIERKIIPREEMSMQRIREWMHANPEAAEEVRRQNRSFVFFRIVGLSDDREAIGAQGVELTAGRSIAVDKALHVYGTPFFIEGDLPIETEQSKTPFRRLMIAQDTGSAIVGPARADLYFGAGADAGKVSGRLRHSARFAILVPKSLDPVVRGRKLPVPDDRPSAKIAKLFPQTDPLKDQKVAAKPPEVSSAAPSVTGSTQTAQAMPATTVPLPVARPDIKPLPEKPRHHPVRRYRHAR